ncbi:MAG: hypothetical protein ABI759_26625 [Candidatus Solibacter sp.]
MKRMVLCAMLLAAPLLAQQNQNMQEIQKLVTLKYADPATIVQILRGWGVNMNQVSATKTMSLTGFPDRVAAVEAAIKQLDQPAKTVELTVYFVVGGDQPVSMAGTPAPQDLRDVIAQLKGAFPYKEYKVLDALSLRPRTGSSAETSGILNAARPPKMSNFSVQNVTVSEDGTTVRIERMHAGLKLPYEAGGADPKTGLTTARTTNYISSGIDQDVDIKEGQKIVVGRSSLEGPQQALFLILTAHVVQ